VNLECRSETCCARLAEKYRTQKSRQKSPSGHHSTTLSGYIFATKAHIDSRKKNLLSSNISSTCPNKMVNFGLLAAEISSVVWGIPANFNGVTAGTSGRRQPNFAHWTEGASYIRQGGRHVGQWPTFLVVDKCHLVLTVCIIPLLSPNKWRWITEENWSQWPQP